MVLLRSLHNGSTRYLSLMGEPLRRDGCRLVCGTDRLRLGNGDR